MNIFLMGGYMMWPLALVSIAVTAIIIERLIFYSSCQFPGKNFNILMEQAVAGDFSALLNFMDAQPPLRKLAWLIRYTSRNREMALRMEGENILARMEKFLPTLSILAKLAPLMGLLGTVLGMISTFSEISGANAGINMNQLAGGIWQALITTAAGLAIAIPALFFLHEFQARVDKTAQAISEACSAALIPDPSFPHQK